MAARLLIATTTWWPSVGVLASEFEQAGFDVTVLCPRGHVALLGRHFRACELDRHRPEASLAATIHAFRPDVVAAGDDRAVAHLRALHRAGTVGRDVLERSLGAPGCHALLTDRAGLLNAAQEAGFAVPRTRALRTRADLDAWIGDVPPPWVLKADGTWGGEGIRIAETRDAAQRTFEDLRRGLPAGLALKRWWLNGDPLPWQERRSPDVRALSVQSFITGRPATCALFADAGNLLGFSYVEAVTACGDHGPALLLRAVERPDIAAQARRLVRRLGLSGFIGLDFLVDPAGQPWLIEMNPRLTSATRMRTPAGPDPVAAAAQAFGCQARRSPPAPRTLFASFPLAWLADPDTPALRLCGDDVPWREPAMLRDSLRPLWPERGLIALLPARLRALRRRLVTGEARPDLRLKPSSWWLDRPSLRPPYPQHLAHETGDETAGQTTFYVPAGTA